MKTAIHAKDSHAKGPARTPANAARASVVLDPLAGLASRIGNRGMQGLIQRKCACQGGTTPCECEEQQPLMVQRKNRAGNPDNPNGLPANASKALSASGPGTPLDKKTRHSMDSRFDHDFSRVRVHTDSHAEDAAQSLQAHAFTLGQHIFFGSGNYSPDTTAGLRLLAHELTHTIQQGTTISPMAFGEDRDRCRVGPANDALEQEADRIASLVVDIEATAHAGPSLTASHNLQRSPNLSLPLLENVPSLDDLSGAAQGVADWVGDTAESATQWAEDKADAAFDWAQEEGQAALRWAGQTAGEAVNFAQEELDAAISWMGTTAGRAAIASANFIAAAFGGSVTISGTAIIITIPNISFDGLELPEIPLGGIGGYFPLLELPLVIGDVPIIPSVGVRLSADLSAVIALGPVTLKGVSLVIDPIHSIYEGTGTFYAAAAGGLRAVARGAVAGELLVIIPAEIPIPIALRAEGGLRWTLTGSLLGAIRSSATLRYTSGAWSFTSNNDLMAGLLYQVDLNAYMAALLNDFMVCEYIWPGAHEEHGIAWDANLPVAASFGPSGITFSAGPLTGSRIPPEDLANALQRPPPGLQCLGLKDLLDQYTNKYTKTGQRVCARPLEGSIYTPGPAFRHAFVHDANTGANYAIRTPLYGGGIINSCATKTSASWGADNPDTSDCVPCQPRPGQTARDVSDCLATRHAAYPYISEYRNLPDPDDSMNWGPNSNSYAGHLAGCCFNLNPTPLGIVPGWSHRPADPCPMPVIPPMPPPAPAAPTAPAPTTTEPPTPSPAPTPITNKIRFQLQAGSREFDSEKVQTNHEITVAEANTALDAMMGRAINRRQKACKDALKNMKNYLASRPPQGVACPPQCGHIVDKGCDRNVTEPTPEGPKPLRIDLNNDLGRNLTS